MEIQMALLLSLSLLLLSCSTMTQKPQTRASAERVPYSRPQQGFLWVFTMNQSGEDKPQDAIYLSEGTFKKELGPFQCSVEIEPEVLDIKKKTIQQNAHLDCGDKQVNTTCETDQHLQPFEVRIEKDGRYLKAMLGCDNGQNEVPPRTVLPGVTILSSAVLKPSGADSVRSTTIFPYQPEQNYAWIIIVHSDRKILKVRTELTYEHPLKEWPGFPKSLKISEGGRRASYDKILKSENGNFILGDQYHVAKNDPGGYLQIRVFIEDKLAEEFWLRFL